MVAGSYVGRVGGLAVVLGIGAALVAGAGVAVAEDDTGSPPKPETTSAPEKPAAQPDGADQQKSEEESAEEESADEESADEESADEEDTDEADGDEDAEEAPEDVVDADDEADDEAVEKDRDRDRAPQAEAPEVVGEEPEAEPEEPPAVEVAETLPAPAEPVDPAEPVAQEPVGQEPVGQEPVGQEPVGQEPVGQEPVEAPETDVPAEVVTTELSVVDPIEPNSDPGNPAVPAMASLLSLVTAGREATDETVSPVGDQVSTSLSGAQQYDIPENVKVEELTPPFEWLQRLPIVGAFVVTPIVAVLHAIPFVGDFLHPLIGFPIDHFAPPGTPQARSYRITSFDGVKIYVNFMPAKGLKAGEKAPTILNGPGLGLPGSTALELTKDSFLPNDVIGIGALRKSGYNVVTWDPRGEWRSGGRMQLQSPDFEGRDISHIISWLSTRDDVELNDPKVPNDPKIGMVGASYGGGIQLASAAIDHRIDAIVPTIAWNDLTDVLFPRQSVRSGWATLLSSVLVLTLARPNERILPAAIRGILFGEASEDDIALLKNRGYADQIGDITAPTLLIQGTVDTLFTLDQADANAKALIAAGTTTKVVWYCGGHGACLSSRNDGEVVVGRTLDWLNRYVKVDTKVDTGEQFEWVDQNGDWHSSPTYPIATGTPVKATSSKSKTIPFVPFIGGSGPNPLIVTTGLIGTILGLPSAAPAVNAVNLEVPDVEETTYIVGAPQLTLTYSGTGNAKHVYAQIVDDRTGLVLGNLATPIPVELDGTTRTVTYSLDQVAHTLTPGRPVHVQIVTSTFNFLNFYSWGSITVEGMSIELPTLAAAEAVVSAAA